MKNYLIGTVVACALLLCSCTGNTTEADPELGVDATELIFDATGGDPQTVTVTANVEWTFTSSASASQWLTVERSDDKLVVSAKANSLTEERNAKITVSPTAAKVKAKEISVKQKAAEQGDMSLSVSPQSLSFIGEDAEAQDVTVTAVGEGLSWTAAPDGDAAWIHLKSETGKITVTVDNNPETTPRAANITVTPSEKSVQPQTVKVTQDGKIVLPSLSIDPDEDIRFTADDVWEHHINVNAVKTEWSAATSDGEGNNVPWIVLTVHNRDGESFVRISSKNNTTIQERSGFVIITPTVQEVEPVTIAVSQEAGQEYVSTLTGDVEIADMTAKDHNEMQFFPNSPSDDQPYTPDPEDPNEPVEPIPGKQSAKWDLFIWGDNLTYDQGVWPYVYHGSGSRMVLNIRSERVLYNDDGEYYLPDGEYIVALNEDELPNTITYGQKHLGSDDIFPRGSWFYNVEDGVSTAAAPITGGKMSVKRNGEEYTLTFDFVDDAGNKITGTTKAEFNMVVMYFPPQDDPIGGGGGEV